MAQHRPIAGPAMPCMCGSHMTPHRTRRTTHICGIPFPGRSSKDAICWRCGNHMPLGAYAPLLPLYTSTGAKALIGRQPILPGPYRL